MYLFIFVCVSSCLNITAMSCLKNGIKQTKKVQKLMSF